MHARRRSLVTLVAILSLALAATPRAAFGTPGTAVEKKAVRHASGVRAAVVHPAAVTIAAPTYAPDVADPGDDAWTSAVKLDSAMLPELSGSYETTARAFASALGTDPVAADEDWFRFVVEQSELDHGYSYLFEAVSASSTVDPVIELYRADDGGQIHPTASNLILASAGQTDYTLGATGCVAGNDDGRWLNQGFGASVSFSPEATGTYYVRVRPAYFDDVVGYDDGAGPYEFRSKIGQFSRLWGADRTGTSIAISRETFPDNYGPDLLTKITPTVVVTNGYKFSDALPGAALAYGVDAPMLLLPVGTVPASVVGEIRRFGASRVIILGGLATVTRAQENALRAIPGVTTVERVAGADRYAVARNIGTKLAAEYGASPFAFIVNAKKYPDALSAASMSSQNAAPVFYSNGYSVDRTTLATMSGLGITDVCIVGGTASVSAACERALKARFGATRVIRIGGADRYEASKNFAKWACELNEPLPRNGLVGTPGAPDVLARLEPSVLGVSAGTVYAEPLAGGAFAGFAGAPVILTPPRAISPWIWRKGASLGAGKTDWFTDVAVSGETPGMIMRSYVFGSDYIVSGSVLGDLDRITGKGPVP